MDNKNIMYKWEEKKEFEYRKKTEKIVINVKKILNRISNLQKTGPIKKENGFNEILEYLTLINVPKMYLSVNDFLVKAIECYKIGYDNLKESQNINTKLIVRAGIDIREGNAYMELSKIEIWKAVSEKENLIKRNESNVKAR